ncbi:MAG: hypothetical protein WC325_08710, partial [Candidatus Bathyarchaeia archaeon]
MKNLDSPKFDFFINVVEKAFLGTRFTYKKKVYDFEPTIASPYDFIKKIEKPSSEYERFLSDLEPDFKATAKTEMYRKDKGWIAQGISKNRIKNFKLGEKNSLVPVLCSPSVGIDTSGINSCANGNSSVVLVCCLDNVDAGLFFLEKHLRISKYGKKKEHKWSELDNAKKQKVLENMEFLLTISSCGLLAVHTNVLISPIGSLVNAFRDLIDGCFTGYEHMPDQPLTFRKELRQKFFEKCNNIPIHCDSDFRPLNPDKIVKILVKTLSKTNGEQRKCTPLHVTLNSEES